MSDWRSAYLSEFDREITMAEQSMKTLLARYATGEEYETLNAACFIGNNRSKRLRAVIYTLVQEMHGHGYNNTIAGSLELIHCASLMIDDIQDHDSVRYGSSAMWVEKGVGQTVHIAMKLISIVYNALSSRVVDSRLVSSTVLEMLNGQGMDLGFWGGDIKTVPEYKASVAGKTSALLVCAVRFANHELNEEDELVRWAWHLGITHQCYDDIEDLGTDTHGSIIQVLASRDDQGRARLCRVHEFAEEHRSAAQEALEIKLRQVDSHSGERLRKFSELMLMRNQDCYSR